MNKPTGLISIPPDELIEFLQLTGESKREAMKAKGETLPESDPFIIQSFTP